MKTPAVAVVCLALGLLLGHFAWPPHEKSSKSKAAKTVPAEETAPGTKSEGAAAKPAVPESQGKPADPALVALELAPLTINPKQESQMLLLLDKDGKREVPIFVGNYEAAAIDRALKKAELPRPLTHDLLQHVITDMGGKLDKVVITALQDSTFHANLVISVGGKQVNVDARPSDAIAVAVRFNAPIFAEPKMLKDLTEDQQREIERLKKEDAEKKEAQPKKTDF